MPAESGEDQIRVLLVDDDDDDQIIVRELLSSAAGDRILLTAASTYEEGLSAVLSDAFEVCLVDYQLGEHNGLELIAEAKQKSSHAEMILLTGGDSIDVDINAARAGAGDYLAKRGLTAAILGRSVRYAVERGKATRSLRRLLGEKDLLIKEVHHRVKNNLQVICSLLSLQAGCAEGNLSADALRQAHNRVLSMSMIHEHLHDSETLLELDFGHYIRSLTISLFEAYCVDPTRIILEVEAEPIQLPSDDAVTCGLILNELVSNALKHAFDGGRIGRLRISFRRISLTEVELTVADDGVGVPGTFEVETARSLGWLIIRTLVDQLGATLSLQRAGGTKVCFSWQVTDATGRLST
jgi:two-component sensor histidine kinase